MVRRYIAYSLVVYHSSIESTFGIRAHELLLPPLSFEFSRFFVFHLALFRSIHAVVILRFHHNIRVRLFFFFMQLIVSPHQFYFFVLFMAVVDQLDVIVVDTSVVAASNGVDPSNPLYLHSSDNLVVILFLLPFTGIGYRS